MNVRRWIGGVVVGLVACGDPAEEQPPREEPIGTGPITVGEPPAMTLRRLTALQYQQSLRDVFGPDLVLPSSPEPDTERRGLIALGATVSSISPRGTENFEGAAYDIAEQVTADGPLRSRVVPCAPAAEGDEEACAKTTLEALGSRLWRRPLAAAESERLLAIFRQSRAVTGEYWEALRYPLAALLQSPNFLFRPELGMGEGATRDLDPWELASRLSFLLWNSAPDDALIAAAADGRLATDDGLRAQMERLLADPRARVGVRAFFDEMFQLHRIDEVRKDPLIFPATHPDLFQAAREETLAGIEHLVFETDEHYREFFRTRRAFLDRRLAALYNIPAPAREGFAMVELPADQPRRGFLGQASFLASQSHPVSSSATRRGLFIREVLLCTPQAPAPAGLNTALPEVSGTTRTLRERVEEHLTNPSCATCHNDTDNVGLGLENFDGLGALRFKDNGVPIDPTGDLDGVLFEDPIELADVLSDHPLLAQCLVRQVVRYATGNVEGLGQRPVIDELTRRFDRDGDVLDLLREVVMSSAFRKVSAPKGGE